MNQSVEVSIERIKKCDPSDPTFNEYVLQADAKKVARFLEALVTTSRHVVQSIDNWKNIQPQVQQDVELLRLLIEDADWEWPCKPSEASHYWTGTQWSPIGMAVPNPPKDEQTSFNHRRRRRVSMTN